MEVSQKPKLEPPYDPEVTLLDLYLKNTRTAIRKDTCIPVFTAALLTIAKGWKQCECPSIDEWKEKMRHAYTHNEILLSR